jgi:DNA-directed RNA polymerase subunit RPC12/RpoP
MKTQNKNQEEKVYKCKICGEPAEWGFNIGFKRVPICNNCSRSITKQTVLKDL